jgi:hypothetical protein
VIEAYIDCGYVCRDDAFIVSNRLTPNGLAEENIFEFIGYMSIHDWKGISPNDHYLAGAAWVLTKEGRARLERRSAGEIG